MSRGLASFLAGLGGGIVQGKQRNEDKARQDKIDQRAEDDHQEKIRSRAEVVQNKRLMQDAMRPVEMQAGAGGMLKPDTMDNADVGLPENQALPNGGLSPQAYRVGGKSYATMQDATAAQDAANSPDARNARISQAVGLTQGPMAAMQFDAAGKQAKLADMQVEEAKRQQAARTFAIGAAEAMAKGDWNGFAQFATDNYADGYTYKATPDSKGGATLTRFDKDGKESGSMPFKSREEAIIFAVHKSEPAKYVEYVTGRKDKEQAQENLNREFDLRKKANESQQAYQNRMLQIREREDARSAATHRAVMESEKLPPAVKMQAGALQDQMKIVSTALAKAMAEGQYDANNPGTQRLLEQQGKLRGEYRKLLGGNADPFGYAEEAQPTKPQAPPPPVMGQPSTQPAAAPAGPGFIGRMLGRLDAEKATMREGLPSAAAEAIQTKSQIKAAEVRNSPYFSTLPAEQRQIINQITFSR